MTTIDERVAFLEGKVEEHSRGFGELRDTVRQVDGRIVTLDEKLDRTLTRLDAKVDDRIANLDATLSERIATLDAKIDQRLTRLDDKMSRQFFWILGIQVAVLVAVIGSLAGA